MPTIVPMIFFIPHTQFKAIGLESERKGDYMVAAAAYAIAGNKLERCGCDDYSVCDDHHKSTLILVNNPNEYSNVDYHKLIKIAEEEEEKGNRTQDGIVYTMAGRKNPDCGCDGYGVCKDHHRANQLLTPSPTRPGAVKSTVGKESQI